MPTDAETTQNPRRTLLGYLDAGLTGCAVADTPLGACSVYVMQGEVLAAHSSGDAERYLAILRNSAAVSQARLVELRPQLATAPTEVLFESVPERVVTEILYERFRENLFRFLTAERVAGFTPMDAVFTDNIQVGHDSRVLIDELMRVHALVVKLLDGPAPTLEQGPRGPANVDQARLWELCADPVPLAELLDRAPWEPSRTLLFVHVMLDEGMLAVVAPPAPEAPPEAAAAAAPSPVTPYEPDDPTDEAPLPPVAAKESAPVDYTTYMPAADDELAAFQDYDTSRVGGDFSSSVLDRVEVLDGAPPIQPLPPINDGIIEMEEADASARDGGGRAVSLNFSGPKLADEDALRKLEVVNEVLATVCEAIVKAEGAGAGAARLQILVEGMSGPLVALFKNVEVSPRGTLPSQLILKNLKKRPIAEHRRLLNRGLSDIIERALSMAYETLDEEGMEAMLENIAGYQQRLGT